MTTSTIFSGEDLDLARQIDAILTNYEIADNENLLKTI